MSNAKTELELAGWFNEDGTYSGMVGESVMELLDVFGKQGHSGMSAPLVASIFLKMVKGTPLTPLTGDDDEWDDVTAYSDEPEFQNKRCSRVFKRKDGSCFDVNGKVFHDGDGVTYTNGRSHVEVTFPYTPSTEVIDTTLDTAKT